MKLRTWCIITAVLVLICIALLTDPFSLLSRYISGDIFLILLLSFPAAYIAVVSTVTKAVSIKKGYDDTSTKTSLWLLISQTLLIIVTAIFGICGNASDTDGGMEGLFGLVIFAFIVPVECVIWLIKCKMFSKTLEGLENNSDSENDGADEDDIS